jgi:hypothetical protein
VKVKPVAGQKWLNSVKFVFSHGKACWVLRVRSLKMLFAHPAVRLLSLAYLWVA